MQQKEQGKIIYERLLSELLGEDTVLKRLRVTSYSNRTVVALEDDLGVLWQLVELFHEVRVG